MRKKSRTFPQHYPYHKRPPRRKSASSARPAKGALFLLFGGILCCLILLLGNRENAHPLIFSSSRSAQIARPEYQQTIHVAHDDELLEIGLEDYLVGVVAAEMPVDYEIEALKAQAVAARTYTLRKMSKSGCNRRESADICTDSGHCQAYADDARLQKRWGKNYEKNLKKIRQAVYATSGEILTYHGDAIDALFHASSGGHTENSEDVYRNAVPYLRGVESPDTEGYEKTVTYTREEFAERINRKLGVSLTPAKLEQELEILSRYESGRVKKIRLLNETFSGAKFRGAAGLPSALFSFTLSEDSITFSVQGYGHGVGMSQSGANHYAKDGWDYRQILTHYYTDVTLETTA